MWVPDGPLPGLCHLFADGRVFGGRVSCLGLCLARTLLLEFVHLTYPLAYRVGIVERNAGTLCQLDSSPGIASGGYHPGLHAPVVPRSGEDFLHRLVVRGSLIVLALYGDTLAPAVHDDVDALIPCSPEHRRLMSHRPEEVGGAGDQGVDIVVNRRGERVAVQCKNYQRPANNKPVQEVFAGARHHRCVEAWVVAPAGYTRGAIELAKSTGVSLYDANTIRKWIGEVDKLEKERASETESKTRHPSPENTPISKEMTEARKRAIWHPHPDDPPDS